MYTFNKKFLLGCTVAFLVYILLVPKKNQVKFDGLIKNEVAEKVWEYVADFSNMKNLNPTITCLRQHLKELCFIMSRKFNYNLSIHICHNILGFSIKSEAGNYEHWEYKVVYTEFLHSLPSIKNEAHAYFHVKPIAEGEYIISSIHKTCFLGNFFCLNSWSDFTFMQRGTRDVYCLEEITYECPRIVTAFCHSEVMFQRSTIFRNLISHFKN